MIENWWTEAGGDPWAAPELRGVVICGEHKGRVIRTSLIKKAEGCVVTTRSGSTYVLGTIKPEFLAYLKECGYKFDPYNPIRLVDDYTFLEPRPN